MHKILTFNLPINQRYLVEKKEPTLEDTGWYNLYSDGWCEQGGIYSGTGVHNEQYTINLSKSYIDTNYSVIESHTSVSAFTTCVYFNTTYSKSTNNFKIQYGTVNGGSYSFTYYWEASGYTSTIKSQSIIKY